VQNTLIAEYWFLGITYLILTVLIIWQTVDINNIIKRMGNLL